MDSREHTTLGCHGNIFGYVIPLSSTCTAYHKILLRNLPILFYSHFSAITHKNVEFYSIDFRHCKAIIDYTTSNKKMNSDRAIYIHEDVIRRHHVYNKMTCGLQHVVKCWKASRLLDAYFWKFWQFWTTSKLVLRIEYALLLKCAYSRRSTTPCMYVLTCGDGTETAAGLDMPPLRGSPSGRGGGRLRPRSLSS